MLEQCLDGQIARAESAYLGSLDEQERAKAADFLRRAREAADVQWGQVVNGAAETVRAPTADSSYDAGSDLGAPAVDEDADADVETGGRRLTAPHLQKELAKLLDCTRLRALESKLRGQGNWPQLEMLKDLRHPGTSHKWLWHVDSRSGTVLAPQDYVSSVQRRLGARRCHGGTACRLCGSPLDPQLVHSDCCDPAGATRGHYAVVRELVQGFKLADAAAATEVRGLTSTSSRPADILTTAAVPGRRAALDVCVAPPNSSSAAADAAESAFRRKLRRYRREIPQLAAAGISFRPMVWTSNGRPHPAATRALQYAAQLVATRGDGGTSAKAFLSRWRHEIQVAILRRSAAKARAVLPRACASDRWLLSGYAPGVPDGTRRARPLTQHDLDEGEADDAGAAATLALP